MTDVQLEDTGLNGIEFVRFKLIPTRAPSYIFSSIKEGVSDLVVRSNPKFERTIKLTPTLEASAALQFAYGYFNDALFGGRLRECLIVYSRKKNVLGHFAPDRFQNIDGQLVPELALNPTYLAIRSDRESLSTLVHEQAHVFRHYYGPVPGKKERRSSGYHDLAWVEVMERIGLIPSNTGKPGGKQTGFQMTHYIADGGPFDLACQALLADGFRINWADRVEAWHEIHGTMSAPAAPGSKVAPVVPTKKDRIKFTCPSCGQNAWARPSAEIACTPCALRLLPEGRCGH